MTAHSRAHGRVTKTRLNHISEGWIEIPVPQCLAYSDLNVTSGSTLVALRAGT